VDDYDKLDVEDSYLARGGTSLRLPMVYGERDYQRREEFILRRVRAGRTRIPVGAGMWLACRGYVRDLARGARLALESSTAAREVLNLCEDRTFSMAMWSRMILDAAGSDAQLVRVPDDLLPEDMTPTGTMTQHIAASAHKAKVMLGWTTTDHARDTPHDCRMASGQPAGRRERRLQRRRQGPVRRGQPNLIDHPVQRERLT